MKRVYSGFTLAEVLITLGIIGIVAAITIPTIINEYQKTQFVAAMKRNYSEFNQILVKMADDYGCPGDLTCVTPLQPSKPIQGAGDEFVKYIKVVKNCGTATLGCFSNSVANNYDGTGRYDRDNDSIYYKFITASGASVRIMKFSFLSNYSTGATGHMKQTLGSADIDVNGPIKGPNSYGRDIFVFYITNGKGPNFYPAGGADDNYDAGSGVWRTAAGTPTRCYSGNTWGFSCSGRVMDEGWEMKY